MPRGAPSLSVAGKNVKESQCPRPTHLSQARVSPSSQMSVCHGCRTLHPSQAGSTTSGLTLITLGLRFLVCLVPVTQGQGLSIRTEVWVRLQELEPLRMSAVIGTENPRMEREPSQGGDLSTARRTTTGVGSANHPLTIVSLAGWVDGHPRPAWSSVMAVTRRARPKGVSAFAAGGLRDRFLAPGVSRQCRAVTGTL